MPNLQVDLYGKQYEFVADTRHFVGLLGGIGSGKSIAGAARAASAALGYLGSQRLDVPNTGMVTAPIYGTLRDATIPAFREVAGSLIAEMNTSPPINATLVNGSTIFFRSAHDPELLRGPSITWWWGDEAALYRKDVWRIMMGRLRQHHKLGYAWLSTTPKGRNWLFQEFVQKQRAQYHLYKVATWQNPFIDPDYYQALLDSYTGDFARQELEGDFVAFEGLIYPFFDRDVHMPKALKWPTQYTLTVAGVDWGLVNPGVIMVYGVDSDGRMWGLHEEYARRRDVQEWANVAKQIAEEHAVDYFFCDPAEPDNIDLFNRYGVRALPAENEVWLGIQSVYNRLNVQSDGLPRIILPSTFVHSAAEYEQYQWMEHKDGLHDKPKKVNDHTMDATRYASVGIDAMFGMGDGGDLQRTTEAGFSDSAY